MSVHDSDQHAIIIDGGGAGGGRILGGGAGGGRAGCRGGLGVPVAAAKAKNRFSPLRLRPCRTHGGIVRRSTSAALIPRCYLRLKRATQLAGFRLRVHLSRCRREKRVQARPRNAAWSLDHDTSPGVRRATVNGSLCVPECLGS